MQKILAMATATVFTSVGTASAEWVKATSDNDAISYYVDAASIKKASGSLSASILTNNVYTPASKNASAVGLILVNCESRTVRNQRVTIYTQQMGRGDVVETKELDQTIKIGANSGERSNQNEKSLEAIFNFICR
ncbi:exported hypothetical protein [Rhodospirillaceae bacterium LM-1]|nr:exported hypothetical protein [Rhodospirillaceae bacterium LM-1]